MFEQAIQSWLRKKQASILETFVSIGRDAEKFPAHAQLPAGELERLMEREWLGLYSFLLHEEVGLEEAADRRKHVDREQETKLPLEERYEFLRLRTEHVRQAIRGDVETARFRERLLQRLDMAVSYYRVSINRSVIEARVESEFGESSD